MDFFTYTTEELLGTVESVDTSTVIIRIDNDDKLRGLPRLNPQMQFYLTSMESIRRFREIVLDRKSTRLNSSH